MNTGTVAVLTALATLLLFSSVLVCSAGAPALPCEFYGTVTIDGSPAPVGTILIAKINDAERGRYVLEEAGNYGGSGTFDQRLKVVTEESDLSGGTPLITFWIDGQKAWQETSYQPGVSLNLDLSIGGEAPAATNTVTEQSTISPDAEIPTETATESVSQALSPEKNESSVISEPVVSEPVISDMPPQLPEMMTPSVNNVSVNVPLDADFIAEPVSGVVPLTVTFTDVSKGGPTLWAWDFGDGTTDTITNPVHQYMMPGTYSVSLTVSNQDGSDTTAKEDYIVVSESGTLKADFSASPVTGKVPLTVQFTDKSSGNPSLYAWEFGDGTGDTASSPSHTYEKDGTYSVSLTIKDDSGADSTVTKEKLIVTGTITPKPTLTPVAIPAVPQTFVGTIEIYGTPIQSGGTVEARAPGYDLSGQFNPIKTAKGVFGKIGTFSPKLQVQGIPKGTDIEFYVADEYNRMSRAYILQDDGSYLWTIPYEPGQETVIRLAVLKTPPTEIEPIPVTPSPTECAGVPSIPMSIQGDVHITDGTEFLDSEGVCHNCQPNINIGGMIEARIEGYEVTGPENPFTMVSSAYFGSGNSSWTDKLTIQGKCLPEDANVTFWVKDDGWPQYTQAWLINEEVSDDNTTITYMNETRQIPYEGGVSRTVHLWAGPLPTVPATPTPTPTPSAWEPQYFYGKAEFNGYPLRVGDRVMATRQGIDLSNPTNPVSVQTFGEYGDPVGKDMLAVDVPYGSIEQRDPISFWIKPKEYEFWYKAQVKNPLSSSDWSDTYPFTPGSITNLDLMSSDRADFMYFDDIVEAISNVILPDDYSGW